MVKFILVVLLLFSSLAWANLFEFGSDKERELKIPALVEKLKNLEMKEGPTFDDSFNQVVKAIENAIEEEKLYCAGEAADEQGKTLPVAQKQLCMRELKKQYLDAMDTVFDLKKKYLALIHQRQMENLGQVQKKLKTDIEKNF